AALRECAAEWGMSAAGWAQGAECAPAETITCDENGMVTQLHLNSKELTGSIPLALTALSHLQLLDLQSNSLSGPVAPALSALRLHTLRLSDNNLTGPVFTIIASMQSLIDLELYSNSFTGPVPCTVSRLHRLSHLQMSFNDFHGPLPQPFTHLTALATLSMAKTGLSGPLLGDITALSALQSLQCVCVCHTSLVSYAHACIACVIDTISDATGNNISGSIPSTITALSRLVYLSLGQNPLLSGSLPRALSRLTTLKELTLDGTNISGELPRFLTALTRLDSFNVLDTKINGTMPATYGSLKLSSFGFAGLTCPMDYTSCEINQNRSSKFCTFCSSFCSTCIPIN
ncbi:unnamed protein product, partial [Closterium sp. Yama58-4]